MEYGSLLFHATIECPHCGYDHEIKIAKFAQLLSMECNKCKRQFKVEDEDGNPSKNRKG